jgi:hypothetical protein
MEIALSLAIVFATFTGPIAAVWVTRLIDDRRAKRARQIDIYRTLMATRRMAISPEHVRALNLIEVEFHGQNPVEDAWRAYIRHLNTVVDAAWENARNDLLAVLLSKIAKHLGIVKGEIDMRNGGYAPSGWLFRDERLGAIQDYVMAMARGEASLPIKPYSPPETSR